MSVLELEYAGKDLIISKEIAETQLGLHPGDRVEIRPRVMPSPVGRSAEEVAEIKRDVEELREAFDPADLKDWETFRKELWASWRTQI